MLSKYNVSISKNPNDPSLNHMIKTISRAKTIYF